jgi:hypothetical protein
MLQTWSLARLHVKLIQQSVGSLILALALGDTTPMFGTLACIEELVIKTNMLPLLRSVVVKLRRHVALTPSVFEQMVAACQYETAASLIEVFCKYCGALLSSLTLFEFGSLHELPDCLRSSLWLVMRPYLFVKT